MCKITLLHLSGKWSPGWNSAAVRSSMAPFPSDLWQDEEEVGSQMLRSREQFPGLVLSRGMGTDMSPVKTNQLPLFLGRRVVGHWAGTPDSSWMGLAAALCGTVLVLPSTAHVGGRDGADGCKGKEDVSPFCFNGKQIALWTHRWMWMAPNRDVWVCVLVWIRMVLCSKVVNSSRKGPEINCYNVLQISYPMSCVLFVLSWQTSTKPSGNRIKQIKHSLKSLNLNHVILSHFEIPQSRTYHSFPLKHNRGT